MVAEYLELLKLLELEVRGDRYEASVKDYPL